MSENYFKEVTDEIELDEDSGFFMYGNLTLIKHTQGKDGSVAKYASPTSFHCL